MLALNQSQYSRPAKLQADNKTLMRAIRREPTNRLPCHWFVVNW